MRWCRSVLVRSVEVSVSRMTSRTVALYEHWHGKEKMRGSAMIIIIITTIIDVYWENFHV